MHFLLKISSKSSSSSLHPSLLRVPDITNLSLTRKVKQIFVDHRHFYPPVPPGHGGKWKYEKLLPHGLREVRRNCACPPPCLCPSSSPRFKLGKERYSGHTLVKARPCQSTENQRAFTCSRGGGSCSVDHPKPTGSGKLKGEKVVEQLGSGMVLF